MSATADKFKWNANRYFDGAWHVLKLGLRYKVYSGFCYTVQQGDHCVTHEHGSLGCEQFPDLASSHVNLETMWDMASITKSVPVAMIILYLVTEGLVRLDDEVTKYVPTLQVASGSCPTIRDLLAFGVTFDLNHLAPPYNAHEPEQIRQMILRANIWQSTWKYSNYAPYILGEVIRVVTGQNITDLAHALFFRPLYLNRITFEPDPRDENIAATSVEGGVPLIGVVHDGLTRALQSKETGISGLFATTYALHRVLRVLVEEGVVAGRTVISPSLIQQIGRNHICLGGDRTSGLGFGLVTELMKGFKMPETFSRHPELFDGAFFRSSYTGGLVAVFPAVDLTVAMACNAVHPKKTNPDWMPLIRHTFLSQFFAGAHEDLQALTRQLSQADG